ncbi:MAG: restriction endonuclease [Burkholderiaceae bacterium]|jgi:restriction system protein
MKFQMNDNSLFAILLRKPWWVSALVAAAFIAFAAFGLPRTWFIFGATLALPFLVIAGIAGWRQLQLPSAARVAAIEEAVRGMGGPAFTSALEDAWRRDGWTVTRIDDPAAEFAIEQGWRRGVVSCRRWKAARVGVEPLRELHAARERLEKHDAIFVAVGEVSEQAAKFAADHKVRIVAGAELARLLPTLGRGAGGGLRRSPG